MSLNKTSGCDLVHYMVVYSLAHILYVLIELQVLVYSHAQYLDGVCE